MTPSPDTDTLRERVLAFFAANRLPDRGPGAYRYSADTEEPTLLASTSAARTRSLLGAIRGMPEPERLAWIDAIGTYQQPNGLFRDAAIAGQGWYANDPVWCGTPMLTLHAVGALTALGGVALRPLRWLDPWRDLGHLERWLREQDWGTGIDRTGQAIMNLGALFQYSRDFHGDTRAGTVVDFLLDWLSSHELNAETGLWGTYRGSKLPAWRPAAVKAAYHCWLLFAYDKRPLPHPESAVDSVLRAQVERAAHRSADKHDHAFLTDYPLACVDPNCRLLASVDHRRSDLRKALRLAVTQILARQTDDGGFTTDQKITHQYGHPQLRAGTSHGASICTWQAVLSLALIGRGMSDHKLADTDWHFTICPGQQFWREG